MADEGDTYDQTIAIQMARLWNPTEDALSELLHDDVVIRQGFYAAKRQGRL